MPHCGRYADVEDGGAFLEGAGQLMSKFNDTILIITLRNWHCSLASMLLCRRDANLEDGGALLEGADELFGHPRPRHLARVVELRVARPADHLRGKGEG